ncbi:MAG: response regulator [Candidatus Cloacimonetes bacterium]|nr:response regulator [Candidatus Cloacimonadota bacterium]
MKKILLIEDEVIIAKALAYDLKDLGLEIMGIASNYNEAIELIRTQKPDLIITDINLKSDKDGIDIAEWVNEFANEIDIIYMTGYGYDVLFDRIKETSYLAIIEKPANIMKIIEILDKKNRSK